MRKQIREFVRIVAETLPVHEPIYEFGALQVPGQEDLADLRPLFPGMQYVGCDIREGPGVDSILDLHCMELPTGTAGTVLVLDTLEHVEFPHKALEEVDRILRPSGMVVITSVMNFPIHEFPHDYWRFTPEGFKSLLRPFRNTFVGHAGDERFPHTVVGLGSKGDVHLEDFTRRYEEWKRRQSWKTTVRSLTPPALLALVGHLRSKGRRTLSGHRM